MTSLKEWVNGYEISIALTPPPTDKLNGDIIVFDNHDLNNSFPLPTTIKNYGGFGYLGSMAKLILKAIEETNKLPKGNTKEFLSKCILR